MHYYLAGDPKKKQGSSTPSPENVIAALDWMIRVRDLIDRFPELKKVQLGTVDEASPGVIYVLNGNKPLSKRLNNFSTSDEINSSNEYRTIQQQANAIKDPWQALMREAEMDSSIKKGREFLQKFGNNLGISSKQSAPSEAVFSDLYSSMGKSVGGNLNTRAGEPLFATLLFRQFMDQLLPSRETLQIAKDKVKNAPETIDKSINFLKSLPVEMFALFSWIPQADKKTNTYLKSLNKDKTRDLPPPSGAEICELVPQESGGAGPFAPLPPKKVCRFRTNADKGMSGLGESPTPLLWLPDYPVGAVKTYAYAREMARRKRWRLNAYWRSLKQSDKDALSTAADALEAQAAQAWQKIMEFTDKHPDAIVPKLLDPKKPPRMAGLDEPSTSKTLLALGAVVLLFWAASRK